MLWSHSPLDARTAAIISTVFGFARAVLLRAGGGEYDDVAQVSKPGVSPTSQSADRRLSWRLRIWKSAIQQVWKPALQESSSNLRPGALRALRARHRCREC